MRYWVAEGRPKGLFGYILWVEKGGFRREAVLELEQIAISSKLRGQGIGSRLVQESFRQLEGSLKGRGAQVKVVEVTTGTDQGAVGFYRRNLGAQVVARIPDLYHGDELLLLARRPGHPPR
jgi:ribosomal protein S18 acetylase RimI-like enzyme